MAEITPPRPQAKGLVRLLLRMPGLFYRMGLGGLMPNTLLLTTTGRRTGRARATPLNYREEGGSSVWSRVEARAPTGTATWWPSPRWRFR